jgi:hypothetical protein
MNPVTTTSRRACAQRLLAHLASTLIVCGGLVVLLPATAAAADLGVTSVSTVPCVNSHAGDATHQFNAGGVDSDDDDSSDDDGDDDVVGGDAAIETGSCELTSIAHVAHFFETDSIPPVFVTSDGHSLRAPPQ